MEFLIEGKDVSQSIKPDAVIATDRVGRADDARFVFERDARWWNWEISRGERIEWRSDGYTTGILYADARGPEQGQYTLTASSIPPTQTNEPCWAGYDNITLGLLLRRYAGLLGLEYSGYGVDETIHYQRAARENESALSFINRILLAESAALKVSDGKLAAISMKYVDASTATKAYRVRSGDMHAYRDNSWNRWGAVRVVTSRFTRTVRIQEGPEHVMYDLPVHNIDQAERWALGHLLAHNATCETMTLTRPLDGSVCALTRVDLEGESIYEGEWVVIEAQHDTRESHSKITLRRAIYK